jgi:hypothetical protein
MSTLLISFLRNFADAEILCPVNVCYTVPIAIYLSGNHPKFYDVDPLTGLGTLEYIRKRFLPLCKAIIFVFQYGNVIDIKDIREYAEKNNVFLLLDYASSFVTEKNIPTLKNNEIGFLSFGYAKQLELGFGGALITNSKNISSFRINNMESDISLTDYLEANDALEQYINENNIINVDYIRHSKLSVAFLKEIDKKQLIKLEKYFYSDHSKIENHKKIIDNIYTTQINENDHIKFYNHRSKYPRWRFNILSDKRDCILSEIFANKLFASKWYPPINNRFQNNEEYIGAERHSNIILNLFNDERISISDAHKLSEIINKMSIQ